MNIVILINDNFFSFTYLKELLKLRKDDIKFIVFSSALIGKKGTAASIWWSFKNTGFRHTAYKLLVYGIFRTVGLICRMLRFVPNHYSFYTWAKRNNKNYVFSANINGESVIQQVKSAVPDLILALNMNQIIKKQLLEMAPKGCLNIHCGPLPRYSGISPYVWVLAHNEAYTATTIQYVGEGLDEGDIIVQEKVNVVKNESAFALFYRCSLLASKLLVKVVDEIEAGTVTSYEQDLARKTYFSWPTKECIEQLRKNGYCLAKIMDFVQAVSKQEPRVK
jgi:methionyl-tRNA formyltransferase